MIIDSKIIAVDFDGTIVEDRYPKIGKEMLFAFDTLKMLQNDGHRLILWTVRSGSKLDEAVDFCSKNGIDFYAINQNFKNEELGNSSRKLNADIFIDDRNIGGFLGWGEIYSMVSNGKEVKKPTKKNILSIFRR